MSIFRNRKVRVIIEVCVLSVIAVLIILYAGNYKEEAKKNLSLSEENSESDQKVFDLWYSYTVYEPYLKEAAARYEEETGIKVRLTYYTTIDYLEKISNASTEGNGPDLFLMSEEELQNAVLLGIAEQNYDTDIYNEDNYTLKSMDSIEFVDRQYGYPLGFETTVFAANKTYVDEMPKTFNDVKTFADNFNNGDDSHDYSNVTSILKWDISDVFYSYGFLGAYLNVGEENGDNPSEIDVNSENAVNAGKYYYSLAEYFYTEAASAEYDNVINEFFEGKIVYTIASADIIARISQSGMSVELSVLPNLTDELKSRAVSVTDIIMVNPFGDMKEEAREFAKLLTYDMAEEMYDICGVISTKKAEYDNSYIDIFLEAYEASVGMPKLMTTSDYWLQVNVAMTNIWNGSDVTEELNKLNTNLDARIN